MNNTSETIAQFLSEHESVMLGLTVEGQEIGIFDEVQWFAALFGFAQEIGAAVCIPDKTRCGVAIYVDLWHAACALLPDDLAKTDLIHALLLIFITSQGADLRFTRRWSTRRGTVLGRMVEEHTLASAVVNELRRADWLDVEAIEALIKRGDAFER